MKGSMVEMLHVVAWTVGQMAWMTTATMPAKCIVDRYKDIDPYQLKSRISRVMLVEEMILYDCAPHEAIEEVFSWSLLDELGMGPFRGILYRPPEILIQLDEAGLVSVLDFEAKLNYYDEEMTFMALMQLCRRVGIAKCADYGVYHLDQYYRKKNNKLSKRWLSYSDFDLSIIAGHIRANIDYNQGDVRLFRHGSSLVDFTLAMENHTALRGIRDTAEMMAQIITSHAESIIKDVLKRLFREETIALLDESKLHPYKYALLAKVSEKLGLHRGRQMGLGEIIQTLGQFVDGTSKTEQQDKALATEIVAGAEQAAAAIKLPPSIEGGSEQLISLFTQVMNNNPDLPAEDSPSSEALASLVEIQHESQPIVYPKKPMPAAMIAESKRSMQQDRKVKAPRLSDLAHMEQGELLRQLESLPPETIKKLAEQDPQTKRLACQHLIKSKVLVKEYQEICSGFQNRTAKDGDQISTIYAIFTAILAGFLLLIP